MVTPLDLINLAAKDAGILGVGQALSAEDLVDNLTRLNFMISEWARQRWLVYHLIDLSVPCTGAVSYTIGPGGAIAMSSRPDHIESAFIRQVTVQAPNQVDFPLRIIKARETYNNISVKQLGNFALYLFYDSAFPQGVLYPWPVPLGGGMYELHVSVKAVLGQFATLTETISLPEEYFAALENNLAIRIAAGYRINASPEIIAMAKKSLAVIRGANTQIATLRMPGDLLRRGTYNPYSDEIT